MLQGRQILAVIVIIAVGAGAGYAQAAQSLSLPAARTHAGSSGQPLGAAGSDGRAGAVARYLQSRGIDVAASSLAETGEPTQALNNIKVSRFEQRASGLAIYGVYAKAAFNDRGELIHLIENLVPGAIAVSGGLNVNDNEALNAAMQRNHPDVTERPGVAERNGGTTVFQRTPFFHDAPSATRVAVVAPDGSIRAGILVETWSQARNLLHHTLVGPAGDVLFVELRTASDSYKVFVEDPGKGGQIVVAGPAPGANLPSPAGWLGTGAQKTTNITGNNANAYLDADRNNRADNGGTTVTNGDFLATASLSAAPATTGNKAVAVQNLFYLNNVIHDILYGHGFVESAGNFQVNNFGKGGAAADPVLAEAQDGSGADNANFSTPVDGKSGRMQMYLWTGVGPDALVHVTSGITTVTYNSKRAQFGPAVGGLQGNIALVVDGTDPFNDGCSTITNANTIRGKIALIDRGQCDFTVKVLNAQSAGAIGVIVANNVNGDEYFTMSGTNKKIRIPSVMISQNSGIDLKTLLADGAHAVVQNLGPPLQVDASLDADIVFHEFGHGLTWRMIGGMSGPMAGAIGEGASDVIAFMVNGDDAIGEYAFSNVIGIRRSPYGLSTLTYKDVTGAEVHDDGEIFAAAMWQLKLLFLNEEGTLLDYIVDGMNYTPATPAFEDMRDGMLASVSSKGGPSAQQDTCRIWQAFAAKGIGAGAAGVVNGSSVAVTESFSVPVGVCP